MYTILTIDDEENIRNGLADNFELEEESIWLTQDMIVKLFDSSKANISEHISHIYKDEE